MEYNSTIPPENAVSIIRQSGLIYHKKKIEFTFFLLAVTPYVDEKEF